jgi:methyl-accepting chemotaxis protein
MPMPTTLRSRLIGSYLIIILICLSVTGVVLALLLVPQVTRLTYLRLAEKALPAALRVLNLRGQGLSPQETVSALREPTAAGGTRILLVNDAGRVLADSQDSWVGRDANLRLPQDNQPASRSYVQGRLATREGMFYYVAVTTSLRPRGQTEREPATWYVVLLAQPREAIEGLIADISLGFIATGVVALLVSVIVAFFVARSVAKPLQLITIATEEIARGN